MRRTGIIALASVVSGSMNRSASDGMDTKELGQIGEEQATRYLEQKGYQVIGRNWRCAYGEIDIIAQDGHTLVFVEVKTRRKLIEWAWEAITPKKRQRMVNSANAYIDAHQIDEIMWRIDVIAVLFHKGQTKIEHGEDALDW